MKKKVFYLMMSAVIALGGVSLYSCTDGDDPVVPPTPEIKFPEGTKQLKITVVDDLGNYVPAKITIKAEGVTDIKTSDVIDYSLNLKNYLGKTVTVQAEKEGYNKSFEESIVIPTLTEDQSYYDSKILAVSKISKESTEVNAGTQGGTFVVAGGETIVIPQGALSGNTSIDSKIVATNSEKHNYAPDTKDGQFALEIIEFTGGGHLNAPATVTFPLSQDVVNALGSLPLQLVSSDGTVVAATLNGTNVTAGISNLSTTWSLVVNIKFDLKDEVITEEKTGNCSESCVLAISKTNTEVPSFYQIVLGWPATFNAVTGTYAANASALYSQTIKATYHKKTITADGNAVPAYSYYLEPLTFTPTSQSCTHSGGGGN